MANSDPTLKNTKKRFFKNAFDIGKKLIDLDDIWAMLRAFLPAKLMDKLGPVLMGLMGGVHAIESYRGLTQFIKAFKNKLAAQRKTKIVIGLSIFSLGVLGAAFSISYFIGSVSSVSLAGFAFYPVIIPGLLTCIYMLNLCKRIYSLYSLNYAINQTKKSLQIYEQNNNEFCDEAVALKTKLENLNNKHLSLERKIAFGVFETTSSSLVLIGIILSTSIIVGSSAATLGILPLSILITGVLLGLACKIIEAVDEHYDHKLFLSVRNFFKPEKNHLVQIKPSIVYSNNMAPQTKTVASHPESSNSSLKNKSPFSIRFFNFFHKKQKLNNTPASNLSFNKKSNH